MCYETVLYGVFNSIETSTFYNYCAVFQFSVCQFSDQGGGSATRYADVDILAGLNVAAVEHDDFVLAVASEKLLVGAVRDAFHQHFEGLTDLFLVVFERYFAL